MDLAGAIVDLDGTVYHGDHLLPGAAAGVRALRAAGLDLCFFSNNPIRDGDAYVERLQDLGIDARPGEACSAGAVTTEYLRANHANDAVMVVGDDGLRAQLRAADLTLTDDPDETDVLVGSWTRDFHYDDMHRALRAVDDETVFLGTDPDRTVPHPGGEIPGSGAIIRALAGVTDREPDAVLGKPSAVARAAALDRLGAAPEDCLVVGDRLETDLAMGAEAGMTTVLVLSGVTDRADLAASARDPDFVIEGLGDVGDVLAAL
jgi:HAD superfamily hydrolase (TIGR01450 family)